MFMRRMRSMGLLAGLAVALLLLGLQVGPVFGANPTPADLKAYRQALIDTRNISQEDVSTRLLAIVPYADKVNKARLHGDSIVWEGAPYLSRVLVVAFMNRDTYKTYYKPYIGQEQYILTRALWVTVVPELKNYFIGFTKCPPTPKRLKQLLGLHPKNDYDALVEFWIDPSDLFRPGADPQTTNHETELAYKVGEDDWSFPSDVNPFLRLAGSRKMVESKGEEPKTYKEWYIRRVQTIYGDADPTNTKLYPWTRLGYTFDWGRANNHIGASEFVVWLDPDKNGGQVVVKLEAGIDSQTPGWKDYFKCSPDSVTNYVPIIPQSLN